MCVFYIAVFRMSLVWSISMNAPSKGRPRALHKAEIPFSWLTGFLLSCGHGCLLTSYCKRQMPCKSRLKVRGGFCQGWKRTWGQIVIKGLTGVWWKIPCMPVWEGRVFTSQHVLYNLQYVIGDERMPSQWYVSYACLSLCVPQPFPTALFSGRLFGSILGCCSALFPISAVLGLGAPQWNTFTLSGNWTMGLTLNNWRSWHENMQWGTLP